MVRPSRRAHWALLRMRRAFDGIEKSLILRMPPTGPRFARPEDRLRGRLEGRTALVGPISILLRAPSPERREGNGAAGVRQSYAEDFLGLR